MVAEAKDAPGVLSFSNSDYLLAEPEIDSIDIVTPESRSIDRKGSIASRLPREILEQILYLTDAETFASLVLVNKTWRQAAEDPQLYAFHLAQCPSYSPTHKAISGPYKEDSLLKFKRLLVQEAKRHLFEVFMRPQETTINLISTTTSSSAAFPYGEKFEFIFSARAGYCLAISSSRIIVLDTASADVAVDRELKVVRRPLAASILQNGKTLAVLSTPHKIYVYDLSEEKPRLNKAIELEERSHTLTLSLHGEVLAAANENGVEVVSLGENALPTEKRAVKCDRVDSLMFSSDGTMLLGTTQNSKYPSTVVLSAPYFTDIADHDMDHAQLISHMWTSQIIFPNSSRDCSHAALLPRTDDHDANWTLTYDRTFESFRAVRTDDLRNGTTYFTGPEPRRERERQRSKSVLVPQTLPTITPSGELVAAAFLGSEIWMYGVPENLDNTAVRLDHAQSGEQGSTSILGNTNSQPDETLPRWQVLVDKHRNVFSKGRRIANVSGVTNICWHTGFPDQGQSLQNIKERLIIAAPGGLPTSPAMELGEEMPSLDGGRIVCLDFNWSPQSGVCREITIEIGTAEPQLLEEEQQDMDTEIAIVRRRTVARRDNLPRSMVSSVAEVLRPAGEEAPPVPPIPASVGFGLDHTINDTPDAQTNVIDRPSPTSSQEGVTLEEAAGALDGPYSQADPRSRNTLYRSATAVETHRRLNPQRTPALPPSGRVEYRRTDGTELPHESDADNWVPPPPPYSKEAVDPLPHHLRHILMSQTSINGSDDPESGSVSQEESSQPASQLASESTTHSRMPSDAPSAEPSTETQAQPSRESTRPQSLQIGNSSASETTEPPLRTAPLPTEGGASTRQLPPLIIPRRPVASHNIQQVIPENTLPETSETTDRRRSVAEIERSGQASPSWLSRHDSHRSENSEQRRPIASRPSSHHYSLSASTTPNSRSPPPTSRRPLSSFEPRSSLYRAALQPASSIAPIQEPVPPPQARQSVRDSIASTTSARRSSSLTLSGPNLQQRLDYPLPPRPEAGSNSPHHATVLPPGAQNDSGPGHNSPMSSKAQNNSGPGHDSSISSLRFPKRNRTAVMDTSSRSVSQSFRSNMESSRTTPPLPATSSEQEPQHTSKPSISTSLPTSRYSTQFVPHQSISDPPQADSQRSCQVVNPPVSQPTSRLPPPPLPPAPSPPAELSAYELMQQQIQNLPPPPPIPSSPTAVPKRRSSRFRSPFRLSTAESSSRPISRVASSLSLRAKAKDQRHQATDSPARQQSTQTAPIQGDAGQSGLSRSTSKASKRHSSKNRLSKRFSRVFKGGEENAEDVPPVPALPPMLPMPQTRQSRMSTAAPTRQTSVSTRGRGRRREEDGAWGGIGGRPIEEHPSGSGAHHGAGSATNRTSQRKKKDKDGKCVVM